MGSSAREAVDRALEGFEREFPEERERMAHACLGLVAEAASRLRRARAAATTRTEGCRICASPKRARIDRMLVVGRWSSRAIARRTQGVARQDVERHRKVCLSPAAKAG